MKKLISILLIINILTLKGVAQAMPCPHYESGLEALQAFRFDEALGYFFECQRDEPFNAEYLSKVGYCYYQLGNLVEAKVYFSGVLKQDSAHVQALNYLATIEEQLLNYRQALSNVEKLIGLDSTNSYYQRMAGTLSEKLDLRLQALAYFTAANRLNPNDQSALLSLCKIFADLGQLEIADTLLDRALWKQPENLRLLYFSAEINYRLRVFDQATPPLLKALEIGDTNLTYLPLLPFSFAQLDSCELALPWFEYLLARKEPTEQMYYFMGFCYQKTGQNELSLEHYGHAIEAGISPNMGTYFQRKGDVLATKKHYRSAIEAYETSLEYGSTDPVIHFHLAIAYDHILEKKKKKPLSLYKKYLSLNDPTHTDFNAYARQRIKELEEYEQTMWKGD